MGSNSSSFIMAASCTARSTQTQPIASDPTTYYQPKSGVGLLFTHLNAVGGRRIAVVGLGAGTLAVYGRPDDYFRFYEINPDVIRISRTCFSYLADCPSSIDIIPGDARLSLDRELIQHFDILVLDAFSGDSIPTHLLTTEAFALYQRHLNTAGVLAVNITNQYLDLIESVAKLGARADLNARLIKDQSSTWILLTNNATLLSSRPFRAASVPLQARSTDGVWTDDYCNLLPAVKW